MAFVLECPNCEAKLKAAQPTTTGKTIRCPKCEAPIRVAEGDWEEVAEATPKRRPPAEPVADAPRPQRKHPTRNEDEDEDEDEEPAPRRRPPAEPVADTPRPKRKRPAPVEEDEDEDDDEDEPVARTPKKPNKVVERSKLPLYLGLGFVGLVLLSVGGYFAYRALFGPEIDSEMYAFLPPDTTNISYTSRQRIMQIPLYKDIYTGMMPEFYVNRLQEMGLTPADLLVVLDATIGKGKHILMYRSAKPFAQGNYLEKTKAKEQTHAGFKYHRGAGNLCYAFPNETLYLEAEESVMKAALERSPLNDEMQSLIREAAVGVMWSCGVAKSDEVQLLKRDFVKGYMNLQLSDNEAEFNLRVTLKNAAEADALSNEISQELEERKKAMDAKAAPEENPAGKGKAVIRFAFPKMNEDQRKALKDSFESQAVTVSGTEVRLRKVLDTRPFADKNAGEMKMFFVQGFGF